MIDYFKLSDLHLFHFRNPYEVFSLLSYDPLYFQHMLNSSYYKTFTIWIDKTPLAIGGWGSAPYDVASLFMLPSSLLDSLFNKEVLADLKLIVSVPQKLFKKTNALVDSHSTKNRRFIEFLGFSLSATLKHHNFDGSDMLLYEYFNPDFLF